MLVFLLACVVSFVPFAALYLWLRNRRKGDIAYKTLCNKALGRGALCVLPVMLFSGVSYIALRLTGLHNTDKLLYQALYNFIVLALMEELDRLRSNRKRHLCHRRQHSGRFGPRDLHAPRRLRLSRRVLLRKECKDRKARPERLRLHPLLVHPRPL